MSEIKVNSIKGVGATNAAITVNNSDGTCTANITNKPNRNLLINGAFLIAQRSTSDTGNGYTTVDRVTHYRANVNENPTFSQSDVAAGTTPYTLGFRKAFKIQNGNQTGGIAATNQIQADYRFEAQDIANSGWDYTSSSSFITLSFWVKSSVSQDFKYHLRTVDGTNRNYHFNTGVLSANTWTKIIKTIPGDSNITMDNDNGTGMELMLFSQYGTNLTGSFTNNAWSNWSSSERTQDQTLTWYATNNATYEITGVQLEVGSVATDFEHRSFAQELALCQRYYQVVAEGANHLIGSVFTVSSYIYCVVDLLVTMRATPTIEVSNFSNAFRAYGTGGGVNVNTLTITGESRNNRIFIEQAGDPGTVASLRCYNANSKLAVTAEL